MKATSLAVTFVRGLVLFAVTAVLAGEAAVSAGAGEKAASPSTTLKIMTYNVWNGMQCGRDRVCEWVKAQKPDVLSMNELNGFTDKTWNDFGKSVGLPYTAFCKGSGYSIGQAAKFPLETLHSARGKMWHGLLVSKGNGMTFISTHLSPFDWNYRLKEATTIVDYIHTNNLDKCVVMGDMNAWSPIDANYLWTKKKSMLERYRRDDENSKNGRYQMAYGQPDFFAISKLLSAPLVDVVSPFVPEDRRTTWPTWIIKTNLKSKETPETVGQHIDFILVSPKLARGMKSARIFNDDPKTEELSDHYPVMSELQLDQ